MLIRGLKQDGGRKHQNFTLPWRCEQSLTQLPRITDPTAFSSTPEARSEITAPQKSTK